MAKTKLKSYLMSINGEIDGLVYYTVGRKTFARKYVKPRNPRSADQQSNRLLFAEAMAVWKTLGEEDQKKYRKKAQRTSMHGHNLFISQYIKLQKHNTMINIDQPAEPVSPIFSTAETSETCTGAAPYFLRIYDISALMQSIYPPYPVPVLYF